MVKQTKSVTRRAFFRQSSLGLAGGALLVMGVGEAQAGGLPAKSANPIPSPAKSASPRPSLATFQGLVGQRFRVGSPELVGLELIKVTDLKARAVSRPGRTAGAAARPEESFSLVFEGPLHQSLKQDIHWFQHESIGAIPVFIVPREPKQGVRRYEAVFNRMPH